MATQADVRRLALSLDGVTESKTDFAFGVMVKNKHKGIAWCWKERIDPKKARVPNLGVLAVRVANLAHKAAVLSSSKTKFFTEPHYNGFPAVLVRIKEVTVKELRVLLEESHRCMSDLKPSPARRRKPSR